MCGFVAICSRADLSLDKKYTFASLVQSTRLLRHRGPDDEAFYLSHYFMAGFRRLKIIDLGNGARQPMSDASGRYWIVFNGEIYNYKELKLQLQQDGMHFRTQSDTEVLLGAYIRWGTEVLKKLNGMFSFLIWDEHECKLFGARDRFGEKPLYYACDEERIIFASEIKGLIPLLSKSPSPDNSQIQQYLVHRWMDGGTNTLFSSIHRVPAGVYFEIARGSIKVQRYWHLSTEIRQSPPKDPIEEFRHLWLDSLKLRLRADVPVGTCLSGGIDSSSIVCSIPHVLTEHPPYSNKTFTALYDEYDESEQIRAIQQRSQTEGYTCCPEPKHLHDLRELIFYHDQPVHSFAAYASFETMRLAKSQGVIVLLNGQGADEVLAGYKKYLPAYLSELIRRGRWLLAMRAARLSRSFSHQSATQLLYAAVIEWLRHQYAIWKVAFGKTTERIASRHIPIATSEASITACLNKLDQTALATTESNVLHAVLRDSLFRTNLPLYLRIEDHNSMAHSLESRLPFLDHRLVEFVFSLDTYWFMHQGWNKYLLRESMRDMLPECVRLRREKFGFPIPEVRWLYHDLKSEVLEALDSIQRRLGADFVGTDLIPQFLREADLYPRHADQLWNLRSRWFRLVCLEFWYQRLGEFHQMRSDLTSMAPQHIPTECLLGPLSPMRSEWN